MEKEPIVLRATIFPDEHPELYERLAKMLPKQKFRRRNVVIQLLKAGCGAEDNRSGTGADVMAVQALVSQLANAMQSPQPSSSQGGGADPAIPEPAAQAKPVASPPSSEVVADQAEGSPYKGSIDEMDINDIGHLFSDVLNDLPAHTPT